MAKENENGSDPWEKLSEYLTEHQMLLLDDNVAIEDMKFENGKIIVDDVHYKLSNLGWSTLCSRMEPIGTRKPPAQYIRFLPHHLQNDIMRWHFAQVPKKRNFMRAKAADDGPFIRAFLSETYQRGRFDNYDFMEIMNTKFREVMPGFRPVSWYMGERVFHVKTLSDAFIEDPVKSTLRVGVTFADSEVGAGSVLIRPFVRREGTGTDLFVLGEAFRRKHTGATKFKDKSGNLVVLDTEALKNGVKSDKLRITRDITDYIDKMLDGKDSTLEETQEAILRYYETDLPIKSWQDEDLLIFFEWLWKRAGSAGLPKGTIKAAVFKLPDYDMKNVWGLFCALCEISQDTDREQQLEYEMRAAKLAKHLWSLLR
jgi:hypothetical protein